MLCLDFCGSVREMKYAEVYVGDPKPKNMLIRKSNSN